MDDLGLACIALELARNAVVEAHTDGDEHVALVRLAVRADVAVHAQHAFVQAEVGGHSRKPQHGCSGGDVSFFEEVLQLLFGTAEDDTLPNQRKGTLGRVDQGGRLCHMLGVDFGPRAIAADEVDGLVFEDRPAHLRVF